MGTFTFSRNMYNIMTTGIAESLNDVLKDAKDLPILWLIEEFRNLLRKWFVNRKQQALSMTHGHKGGSDVVQYIINIPCSHAIVACRYA